MRFLLDADLPRSAAETIHRHGHEVVDVRDVGLRDAEDQDIAAYARRESLCLLTGDYDFSDIRNYPPEQYAGIVVLNIPAKTTSLYINQLLATFLAQTELLPQIPGKLAIVEPGRVRLRSG